MSPDWLLMAIETLFVVIFDPRSSIVKDVFDCHLSSVILVTKDFETLITGYATIQVSDTP